MLVDFSDPEISFNFRGEIFVGSHGATSAKTALVTQDRRAPRRSHAPSRSPPRHCHVPSRPRPPILSECKYTAEPRCRRRSNQSFSRRRHNKRNPLNENSDSQFSAFTDCAFISVAPISMGEYVFLMWEKPARNSVRVRI